MEYYNPKQSAQEGLQPDYYQNNHDPAGLEVAPNQGNYKPGGDGRKEGLIFGLRKPTFFLSLALVVVIIAAAVGGGVGGSLGGKKSNCSASVTTTVIPAGADATACPTNPSSSSGPSKTASSAPSKSSSSSSSASATPSPGTFPPTGSTTLACSPNSGSNLNGTTIQLGAAGEVTDTSTFSFEILCGFSFPANTDILPLISYSIQDCAAACAGYNHNNNNKGCTGVQFNAEMENNFLTNGGNCWLKNSTDTPTQDEDVTGLSAAGVLLI